jgi:hypothetical protein
MYAYICVCMYVGGTKQIDLSEREKQSLQKALGKGRRRKEKTSRKRYTPRLTFGRRIIVCESIITVFQ